MEGSVYLLLRLQPSLSTHVTEFVARGVAATPACSIVHRFNSKASAHLVVAVTQPINKAGDRGDTPAQAHSSGDVLRATAWLEQHAQVPDGLVEALQSEGHLKGSPGLAPTAAVHPYTLKHQPADLTKAGTGSSASGSISRMQMQAGGAAAVAPSPAGPTERDYMHSAGAASSTKQPQSLAGSNNTPEGQGAVAFPTPVPGDDKAAPGTTPPGLIPLLYRCGILEAVVPVHSPEVQRGLLRAVWSSLLAPVSTYRYYFGDQVGFYLAYLNALTCWLLVPAAIGACLHWGASNAAGLSSPLAPIGVLVQLLWSAAGVQLWRRQQALLARQWHSSSTSESPTPATANAATDHPAVGGLAARGSVGQPRQHVAAASLSEEAAAPALAAISSPVAADVSVVNPGGSNSSSKGTSGAPPTVPASHFKAGLPWWALRAPTATGTRWQFAGCWQRDASGVWQLRAALLVQLLRLVASLAATGALLLLAGTVLLACLNVQGLIVPTHTLLFVPQLAAFTLPGGLLTTGLLGQVPMVVRVLAVTLYDSKIFGPAAKALTAFENHRTLEGFDASLTAKKAALQLVFTFVPLMYVGLAGAGAAAAANDAAGYFRFELVRRLLLEFAIPWVSLLRSTRAKAANVTAAKGNTALSPVLQQAVKDSLRPAFDPFSGTWDVTRDTGYVMLLASILPWAAPLTLLYTLAKVKQECMALVLVYQRPMPQQMRSFGSWNNLLLLQVYLAVLTNTFLSGLSSGQLAQLLPSWLVPDGLADALTTAAEARPSASSAASQLGHEAAPGPMSSLVFASSGAMPQASHMSSAPMLWPDFLPGQSPLGSGLRSLQAPSYQFSKGAGAGAAAAGQLHGGGVSPQAATTHLLVLFGIEHLLLLLVTLVLALVPAAPATQGTQQGPEQVIDPAAYGDPSAPPSTSYTSRGPESLGAQGVPAAGSARGAQGSAAISSAYAPVLVHRNPLFTFSTARRSEQEL